MDSVACPAVCVPGTDLDTWPCICSVVPFEDPEWDGRIRRMPKVKGWYFSSTSKGDDADDTSMSDMVAMVTD